jgi:hypothetical protein
MSRVTDIHTNPEGADIYTKPYEATGANWQFLGRSPIEKVRLPLTFLRWKVQKEGYGAPEMTLSEDDWWDLFSKKRTSLNFALTKAESVPAGMVRITGGSFSLDIPGLDHLPEVPLQDYWIDRYEVTNRDFKKFVDAGGYANLQYWKETFIKDGRAVSWQEAMQFRDRAGRPGPATWQLGDYPEGQGDFPVTGVSWYEAAAYAELLVRLCPRYTTGIKRRESGP